MGNSGVYVVGEFNGMRVRVFTLSNLFCCGRVCGVYLFLYFSPLLHFFLLVSYHSLPLLQLYAFTSTVWFEYPLMSPPSVFHRLFFFSIFK